MFGSQNLSHLIATQMRIILSVMVVSVFAACSSASEAPENARRTAELVSAAVGPVGDNPEVEISNMALIIGNAAYNNIEALDTPVNDARLISRAFNGLEVQTETRTDLTLSEMVSGFQDFLFRSGEADVDLAIIYYGGHAVQINGQNYLVPVDYGSADVPTLDSSFAGLISVSRLIEAIETSGIRRVLFILDACRENPFVNDRYGVLATDGGNGLASPPQVSSNSTEVLFLYSTAPGQPALDSIDDDPVHSPFAGSFARWVVDTDRTFDDVVRQTITDVKARTFEGQVPWISGNFTQRVGFGQRPEKPVRLNTAGLNQYAGEGDLVIARSIRLLIDSHKEESRRESQWTSPRDVRYVAISDTGANISVNTCQASVKVCYNPDVAKQVVERCEEQSEEDCGLFAVIENGAMETLWNGKVETGRGVRPRAEAIVVDLKWTDVGPVRGRVDYAARGPSELTFTMERTGVTCRGTYLFGPSGDGGTFNGSCKDGTIFSGEFARNSAWSFEAWGTDSQKRDFNGYFSLERAS